MVFLSTEVKRFEEGMFSCTTREVACQEVGPHVMLLKGTEFFDNL